MWAVAALFTALGYFCISRVQYGTGAPTRTTLTSAALGLTAPVLYWQHLPTTVAAIVTIGYLASSAYLAYTVKLPERFIDWSISTRAYTSEAERERNYTHVRLWNIPKPLFSFLARHKWSVTLGLLLPGEHTNGIQLTERPIHD